ncbi:MAG: cytochrome c4 [Sterolibacteriaceae bacterium]|nr:cytochrome c4 [Candidatus Methylophosphatis haderslevensis]
MILRSLMLSLAVAAGAAQAEEKMAAKPDPAKAQQTASTVCAGCHGADGNSVAAANPKIAGQHPEYLYKQLKNFKTPEGKPDRSNAIMGGMVAALSDDDMKGLAAYFAAQKLKPESAKDAKTVEVGQKLYRAGDSAKGLPACAGCHGPAGAGIPAQYPRISGQYAEYTEAQLKAFRAGERANDPNQMMRVIALKMTDPEIKAVSDYIAGLR